MNKNSARGFSSLIILVFVFVLIVGSGLYLFFFRPPFFQKMITGIDTTDPDWKMTYCSRELSKLPGPSFSYDEKSDVNRTGPTVYVRKMIPDTVKYSDIITCSFDYEYDEETAWPSVGVEYRMHIDNSNAFKDRIAEAYASAVDSSWTQLPRLPKDDAGNPHYVTDALPLVFTRENRSLGTVEYLNVFTAVDFYVKLSVYEK